MNPFGNPFMRGGLQQFFDMIQEANSLSFDITAVNDTGGLVRTGNMKITFSAEVEVTTKYQPAEDSQVATDENGVEHESGEKFPKDY